MNSALTSLTTLYAGIPLWAWIAAGLAVLVLIILIISVSVASRRRSKWDRSFDLRMADARWFADSLTLAVADRTKSTPELVRTWTDGVPRMSTLSQQLYELSTIAPTDWISGWWRRVFIWSWVTELSSSTLSIIAL